MLRALALSAVIAVVVSSSSQFASAAPIAVFSGVDLGDSTSPFPNADAARNAFNAFVGGGLTVENFETQALGFFSPMAIAGGASVETLGVDPTLSGVTATGTVSEGFNTTPAGARFLRITPSAFGTFNATAEFSLPAGTNAFGFYYTGDSPTIDGVLHVLFNDGSANDILLPNTNQGTGFFGFVTGVPIASVTIQDISNAGSTRDIFGIDDVQFGVAAVPEPASLLAFTVVGLVALGSRSFRRRD